MTTFVSEGEPQPSVSETQQSSQNSTSSLRAEGELRLTPKEIKQGFDCLVQTRAKTQAKSTLENFVYSIAADLQAYIKDGYDVDVLAAERGKAWNAAISGATLRRYLSKWEAEQKRQAKQNQLSELVKSAPAAAQPTKEVTPAVAAAVAAVAAKPSKTVFQGSQAEPETNPVEAETQQQDLFTAHGVCKIFCVNSQLAF